MGCSAFSLVIIPTKLSRVRETKAKHTNIQNETSREMFMFEKNLIMGLERYSKQKRTGIEIVLDGTKLK
jgi:hypothetical protein